MIRVPGQSCLSNAEPLDVATLARERWDELVGALAAVCWDGLDPTDLAQEALTIAYAKYANGTLGEPENLLGYVVGIGKNVAKNQRGKRRRADTAHREAATTAARTPRRDLSDVAVENADLARAYRKLKPVERKVLLLASDGFDNHTIADLLGLPTDDAAKQVLYRARQNIKGELAAPCVTLSWWWWRRWTHGRAAESAASVADRATPAVGPLGQGVAMSAAVAFTLVAALAPGDTGPAEATLSVPAARAPFDAPAPVLGGTGRAVGTSSGPAPFGTRIAPIRRPADAVPSSTEPGLPVVGRMPVPVPTKSVASACTPTPTRRECAEKDGDTLWMGEVGVTQAVVPVCHRVTPPPPARCTRKEPDAWVVKDLPPVTTGGTT